MITVSLLCGGIMPGHDIIVMGASAGGVEALMAVVRRLPHDLPAAVFIVLHIPAQSPSSLPHILGRSGRLEAVQATDGAAIEHGCIYVAPPDHHLLVEPECVRVTHGPKENHYRPAVDPLFRSAARAYGPRVVGVVLTGALDDGTAGLLAIKRRGGLAVVQDPDEALFPSMPRSALANVKVDYNLPISRIGPLLVGLVNEPAEEESAYPIPREMEIETRMAEMDMDTPHHDENVGTPSAFSCPECGGVLWELRDGELLRFRYRVGHAFSIESMIMGQSEVLEEALWIALKSLEESVSLSRRMAADARRRGQDWLAQQFEGKLHDAERHVMLIRQVLLQDARPAARDMSADQSATGSEGQAGDPAH